MSSSFVKDCSDSSRTNSTNTNKTVIIIVNNETGNAPFDGNELQNLLATHGADPSQVSVVQMGMGAGNAVPAVAAPDLTANFGGVATPLNFMLDGFPAIPLEGSALGGYAELPLDADALRRLESVLETEEAKDILGEPLLDIVNDPNSLTGGNNLEKLFFNQDSVSESVTIPKRKRAPPKRRSQRQVDKAEREEVEKILAENQLMLRKERELMMKMQEEEERKKEEEEEEKDEAESGDFAESGDEEWEELEEEETKTIEKKGKSVPALSTTGAKGKGGKKGPTEEGGVVKGGKKNVGGKSVNKKGDGAGGKKMPKKGEVTGGKKITKGEGAGGKKIAKKVEVTGGKKIAKKGEGSVNKKIAKKEGEGGKKIMKGKETPVKKIPKKGEGTPVKKIVKKGEGTPAKKIAKKGEGTPVKKIAKKGEGTPVKKMAKKGEGTPVKKIAKKGEGTPVKKIAKKGEGTLVKKIAKKGEETLVKKIANKVNKEGTLVKKIVKKGEGTAAKKIMKKGEGTPVKKITKKGEGEAQVKITSKKVGEGVPSKKGQQPAVKNVTKKLDGGPTKNSVKKEDLESKVGKKAVTKQEEELVRKEEKEIAPNDQGGEGGIRTPEKMEELERVEAFSVLETEIKVTETAPEEAVTKPLQNAMLKSLTSRGPKGLAMKELSVKVTKLNDKLIEASSPYGAKKGPIASNEKRFSNQEEAEVETPNKGDEEQLKNHNFFIDTSGNGERKHAVVPLVDISDPTTATTTAASAGSANSIIEKGSNHQPKLVVNQKKTQTISSESSLSKVQNPVVSQIMSSKLDLNISRKEELKLTSEVTSTLTSNVSCAVTILSDEKGGDMNVDSKNNFQSLIPAQNFSDKAGSLHSQMDISRGKSLKDYETDLMKNSTNTLSVVSEGKENRSASHKLTRNVEVLIPKEKSEVYVLSSVIAKNQRENSEATRSRLALPSPPKKLNPGLKQSDKNTVSRALPQSKSELACSKQQKLLSSKEDARVNTVSKLVSQSPSISKSLMNYKIPLKNSANKATHPLGHQRQSNFPHNLPVSQHDQNFPSQKVQHNTPLPSSPINKATALHNLAKDHNSNPNPHSTYKDSSSPSKSKTPTLNRNNPLLPSQKNNQSVLESPNPHPTKNVPPSNSNFNPQNKKELKSHSKIKAIANGKSNIKADQDKEQRKTIAQSHHSESHGTLEKKVKESHNPKSLVKGSPLRESHKMSSGMSQIRRSGRPVKKKKFGDDILFLDEKTSIISDDERSSGADKESSSEDEVEARKSSSEESNDSEEEDGGEDDDPERLWCICQRPHNNRFMICCDRCEDWFHGSCVGITKPMGRQIEEEEREWICPNCRKAEKALKGISSPPPRRDVEKPSKQSHGTSLSQHSDIKITKVVESKKKDKSHKSIQKQQEKQSKEKTEPRVLVYEKATGIVLSGTAAPTLNVLADWLQANPAYTTLQPAMMNSINYDPKIGTKRINLEEFGLKPEKPSKLDRSFSFQEKIDSGSNLASGKEKKKRVTKLLKHADMVKLENSKKQSEASSSTVSLPVPKGHKTDSPKKKNSSISNNKERKNSLDKVEFPRKASLSEVGRSNSFEESPSSKKSHKDSPKDPNKKTPIKSPEAVDKIVIKSDVMKVRNSVRKMLYDALEKRRSEVKSEFENITEENLQQLCKEIEEHLFTCFNKDVGFKYKSRYRSLVFNIRDSKNSGLFRKILNKTIAPEKLAFMTSEELASKELAEWREREEKKELEAIQKHELERIALGEQYIMKSHKGEIVIDKEEFPSKNKDTESVISLAPDPSKSLADPDFVEDETTINHKNHIYDPACKICNPSDLLSHDLSSTSLEEVSSRVKSERSSKHEDESDKERVKKKSSRERRESESSSHHHSKHKKKDRERRHSHKSRDKDKHRDGDRDKDRDKDKDRDRDRDKDRDKERDREKDKHSRDRDKSSRSDRDRHHHDRSSRDERSKEDRKRRHSGSRREDRKRRESDTSHKRRVIEGEIRTERKDSNKENEGVNTRDSICQEGGLPSSHSFTVTSSEERGNELLSSVPEDRVTNNAEEIEVISEMKVKFQPTQSPLYEKQDDFENLISLTPPPLPDEHPSYSPPDRSPSTPPLPIDLEEELLSPATPPLPDEDRLTPPPPSTTLPLPPKTLENGIQMPIWKGVISMPDVAKFSAAGFEVSGKALFFTGDVPSIVEVVGRINPDTVWSYIAQMKKSGSKEILVVRFQPSSEEEKVSYIALYSYLSSKKRYGVIGNCEKSVKDFYVVPLASHQPIPQVLLPLDGPGFEESRPHMLIGVIVRTKHRRIYDPLTASWTNIGEPSQQFNSLDLQDDNPTEEDSERSYTPPPTVAELSSKRVDSLIQSRKASPDKEGDDVESDAAFTPSPLSTDGTQLPPNPAVEGGNGNERESMLAELNRQIERDRKELSEMQKKVEGKSGGRESSPSKGNDDDETGSGSPSAVDTSKEDEPSLESGGNDSAPLDTSKINLPSNLHEILASIKRKEEAIREKEDEIRRRMRMADIPNPVSNASGDVDLRLVLGSGGKDQDMRRLGPGNVGPRLPPQVSHTVMDPRGPANNGNELDFRSRDPRIPGRDILPHPGDAGVSLSNMSDADLLAKAIEMEVPPGDPAFPGEHEIPSMPPIPHGIAGPPVPPPFHGAFSQDEPVPPNPAFANHPMPLPGFQPPNPFTNPPNNLPIGPLGPPIDRLPMSHRPSFNPGSQLPGPHFGGSTDHIHPRHPDDFPPYPYPGDIGERRPRREEGRSRSRDPWDHRSSHQDPNYWRGDDWEGNSSWYPPEEGGRERKRRWKDNRERRHKGRWSKEMGSSDVRKRQRKENHWRGDL